MIPDVEIRETIPDDFSPIEQLYAEAFPTEDLLPLVRELLADRNDVLSLVATSDNTLIAHASFTLCEVDGHDLKMALLGPLAVAPAWQKKGIGSAIVHDGFHRMKVDRISHIFVLGDPAYYRRFGFTAEKDIAPVYPLPPAWIGAWQSVPLGETKRLPGGTVRLPTPWLRRELWNP